MRELESQIKKTIVQYLKFRNVFCWVNSSTGIYDPTSKKFRKLTGTGMRKGVSDILGMYNGKLLAIEVKSKTGRLSEEQKFFLEDVVRHGGIGFVARSIEDVEKHLFV